MGISEITRGEESDGVGVVFPFHPGRRGEREAISLLKNSIGKLARISERIVVVNDGYVSLPSMEGVHIIRKSINEGKVAASKRGISYLVSNTETRAFVVADYDDEQELNDTPSLLRRVSVKSAVIGNRYGLVDSAEMPEHRRLANMVQSAMAKSLGFNAVDLPSGLIACSQDFAQLFVRESRTCRESVGIDWLCLAALHGYQLSSVAIRASMRSGHTEAAKLARNFAIPLGYEPDLRGRGFGDVVEFCKFHVDSIGEGMPSVALPMYLLSESAEICIRRNSENGVVVYSYCLS